MFTKNYFQVIILISCISIFAGCTTSYWKRFNTIDSKYPINNSFEFRNFGCGINISTRIFEKKDKTDSLYYIWFCIDSKNNYDEKIQHIFETIKIENISISYLNTNVDLSLKERDMSSNFRICIDYDKILIPNDIDTAYFYFSMSYLENSQEIIADTTIPLYRYESQKRDIMHF